MNIFALHKTPKIAAQSHCDQHVVKMITESVQMLSTAHHVLNQRPSPDLYEVTHINHPANLWIRKTSGNYYWLLELATELIHEYDYRFGKPNKYDRARDLIEGPLSRSPFYFEERRVTRFALAFKTYPELQDVKRPIESYRKFYVVDKSPFARWDNGRDPPDWYIEMLLGYSKTGRI